MFYIRSYIVRVWVGVSHATPVEAAIAATGAVGVSDAVVEHEAHDRVLRGEAARAVVALVVAYPEHVSLDIPIGVNRLAQIDFI